MEAGRKLDALIAEHVMALVVFKNRKGGWSVGAPDYYDDHGSMELLNPLPQYSTDIVAAWEVLSKIGGDNYTLSFSTHPHEGGQYSVYLGRDICKFLGESAPHAICLAALEAMNYKLT